MMDINRAVVFAHYDPANKIKDDVIFYLKELKKISNFLVFVSDSDLSDAEVLKINKIANVNIVGRHGEYDFGSYKKGYIYLKEKNFFYNIDELIFVNDSCYGPLKPLSNIFLTMENNTCDFWGITANKDCYFGNNWHIQSFFVGFSKKVFTSEVFDYFMNSIKKETNKKDIVEKYEYGLTRVLEKENFTWDVFCKSTKYNWCALILFFKSLIVNENCPLLKKSIVSYNVNHYFLKNDLLYFIQKYTDYDYKLILEDINSQKNKPPYLKNIIKTLKRYLLFYIIRFFDFLKNIRRLIK